MIKNWRPVSLLNIDAKRISKILAKRIKKHLPSLISSNQTACVDKKFITEGRPLISDILEITDLLKIKGLLLTVDIEKAFDSVDHQFLINLLKTFGFEKNLVRWITILLKNQESCIINGAINAKYFKLEKSTRQGDPISDKLRISEHDFLYTANADDTTFFVKNQTSVIEILKIFDNFSKISSLKSNKSKCEIAGIGDLKRVRVALCGMQCINLNEETVTILGIHFSYNKKLEEEKNFNNHIATIQNVLRACRMRDLTIEGKIVIFKSLAISKIVHLALIKTVPIFAVQQLNIIKKNFIWQGKKLKIKQSTLCNSYENGGLKDVNIFYKISHQVIKFYLMIIFMIGK